MITSHTTSSIEDFLNDFSGREGMQGYDDTKRMKIAEENRDFVWPKDMWVDFILSIFAGYPIPLMVVCNNLIMDGGNRSTVLKKWKQNEFIVKYGDWEGNYDAMIVNPSLSARWNRCVIPMTIITNASDDERAQIYENCNKGITLTTGQLLKNRAYRPLAEMACSLIRRNRFELPFRDLLSRVWKSSWKTTKTLGEVSTAYSIVTSSIFGPEHFHTKFPRHLPRLMSVTREEVDMSNLQQICEVMDQADPNRSANKKKKEVVFKKFIGAIIHDFHMLPRERFTAKWQEFCTLAYTTLPAEQITAMTDVQTARGNNLSRIQRISRNVDEFLERRAINHDDWNDHENDEEDEYEDDESDE